MIIEREVRRLSVTAESTVEHAMRQIDANQSRAVFVVDAAGVLVGVLTDGDVRRWLLEQPGRSLDVPVIEAANASFVSLPEGVAAAEVERTLSDAITLIPMLDDRGRLVGAARRRDGSLWFRDRLVDATSPAFVVAEIGINHNGSLDEARRLVDAAVAAGADAAKFQLRDLAQLYRNSGAMGDAREDLGPQYTLDLLSRFALENDEMAEAFDYCRSVGILALCTPWDLSSAAFLADYGIDGYKIASADVTNHDLVRDVSSYGTPVIMSTGMSHEDEIVEAISILRASPSPYALLHVNSTYPTPFRDVQLRYMDRLAQLGDCIVGYSGHERGHHVVLAAVARGAKIVEKHITRDRDQEGNDHRVSLLPGEFRDLVVQLREVEEALGDGMARTVSQGEQMNRVNLAKSVVAATTITKGQIITRDLLDIRSPGQGLQPNRRDQLVGRVAGRDLEPGDFFYEADLSDSSVVARRYAFDRPWGLPVRYHDFERLAELSNPDFIEFHMSYNDIDLDPLAMVPERSRLGLVVHSPELFRSDHLLDLAADDPTYRQHSIDELQRVIDVTRALRTRFEVEAPTPIVTNLGGFSRNGPIPAAELPRLYDRIAEALDRLDDDEVEVLAQTLPPFPWYLGGQLYCNLFVDADSTAAFAADTGRRICLDIAHTRLACTHRGDDFNRAIDQLAPVAAHLHIVDAAGVGEEGLQIGLGDVDFDDLGQRLRRLAPTATFIPEIWQGHQNGGEGFWVALDRLEGVL